MENDQYLEATTVTYSDNDVILAALADKKLDQILNSDSAYHLCEDRNMFSTYSSQDGELVCMANNIVIRVATLELVEEF